MNKYNHKLFNEARKYIPGGVNSPVRSFKAVGGEPVFINRASGSKIYEEGGRKFIDYCLSWGAMILGHAHPKVIQALNQAIKKGTSFGTATKQETELARLITEAMPSINQVRLTSSGTEAVMSAIRLARAYTRKNKIIKFNGSYHGHADYLLVKSGSGAATLGIPDSLGVPQDFTKHTIVVPYNDINSVEEAIKKHQKDLAAIIIEPVAANCGIILPKTEFLQQLRKITQKNNIVLIFDEVITGFRLSYGGAQNYFNVKADLTCLGKIIGGGLPVGAFGGRREIMKLLSPLGGVYQAGTLSGNPIAVAAGIATLKALRLKKPYSILEERTEQLCESIASSAKKHKIDIRINHIGSMFSIYFTDKAVTDYKSAKKQNTALFKTFFQRLLKGGIYFSPSGFEANFLSITHSAHDIKKTSNAIESALRAVSRKL